MPAVSRPDPATAPDGATPAPPASTAFKDRIDAGLVGRLATALREADPAFPAGAFTDDAVDGLAPLELKARIAHVAAALGRHLPGDFERAAAVVTRLADALAESSCGGAGGAPTDAASELGDFDLWPLPEWVALHGRSHPAIALDLLARLTPYATGEFAIRPFLDDDPEGVLAVLDEWAAHSDEHVRRLVTEGTRPRLPWAPRLAVAAEEPGFAVHLLDRLVEDPSEYVRRSVSNHLNDLCRIDAELGIGLAQRWSTRAAGLDEEGRERIGWVVRRGLRSLVKSGHLDALRLLGHDPDAAVRAEAFEVHTPVVVLGDGAEFSLVLCSEDDRDHRLVVDYVVHHPRANGTSGPKVFKWTTLDLGAGERRELRRRHPVRPITTRTYRSGEHRLQVQVNGVVVAEGSFTLELPSGR